MRIGPDEPFQRYGHSKLYETADGRDLGFGPTESRDIRSADLKTLPQNQTRSELHDPLQKYGHSTFSKMRGRSVVGRWSVGRSSVLNILH